MLLVWLAMNDNNLCILSWNVRGLNCPARRATVHETIASTPCNIVCLQETKLANIDQSAAAFLGGHRLKSFAERPADGTRGGILLWNEDVVKIEQVNLGTFFLSAMVTIVESSNCKTSSSLCRTNEQRRQMSPDLT